MTKFDYHIENKYEFVKSKMAGRAKVAGLAAAVAVALAAVATVPAGAEPGGLDGSWSGGGSLTYPSGAKESARCKASFKRKTGTSYAVNARCASASGKIEQSATLQEVGANRYSGSFFNTEFKVDGTITVTVQGNSQSVSISSPAGSSANFRLTR
jgi:hypothetical protein